MPVSFDFEAVLAADASRRVKAERKVGGVLWIDAKAYNPLSSVGRADLPFMKKLTLFVSMVTHCPPPIAMPCARA